MKRKVLSVLLVLALVLSFSLVTAMPVAAATDRLVPSVYGTIQEAINAADPGDTIIVAAGTYDAAVKIGKQLTLLGAQHGVDPTVAGARTDEDAESIIKGTGVGHLVDISADGVTVDGFTITGATGWEGNGIRLNGANGTTIENNIITENNADGISMKWADNNLIQNNVIKDNAKSVTNFMKDCWRANGINIQFGGGNTVKNNVVLGQYNGIYLTGEKGPSLGNTLTGNIIEDNSEFGILLAGGRNIDNIITNNDIKNNRVGIYQRNGIPLGWGWKDGKGPNTGNEAHYNNIVGNTEYGVQNVDTTEAEIFDATNNWWGSNKGPFHPTTNTEGDGDPVSDNVLYDPWTKRPIPVEIDIKPGSDPNSINLKSKGVVPVAVLTTDDFNANTVDPETVVFAGAEPVRWTLEDVDDDGDLDMLFHFKTQELNLTEESTEATLTGSTDTEQPIQGTDTVNIVPKGKGPK